MTSNSSAVDPGKSRPFETMFVGVLIYFSYMLMTETLLTRAVALGVTNNDLESQLTRIPTERDYWIQKAIEEELLDDLAALLPMVGEANPEGQFPHYYANNLRNMRNDAYLLDNSVKMTPSQKGDIKKKSFSTWIPSCSCESTKEMMFLGEGYSPMGMENHRCSGNCDPPYECKPVHYLVPVLKNVETSDAPPRWEPQSVNITTSCVCIADKVNTN